MTVAAIKSSPKSPNRKSVDSHGFPLTCQLLQNPNEPKHTYKSFLISQLLKFVFRTYVFVQVWHLIRPLSTALGPFVLFYLYLRIIHQAWIWRDDNPQGCGCKHCRDWLSDSKKRARKRGKGGSEFEEDPEEDDGFVPDKYCNCDACLRARGELWDRKVAGEWED